MKINIAINDIIHKAKGNITTGQPTKYAINGQKTMPMTKKTMMKRIDKIMANGLFIIPYPDTCRAQLFDCYNIFAYLPIFS